jgi:hypothetical protein
LKGSVGQGASIHLVTERGTVTVRKAGAQSEDSDKTETRLRPPAAPPA